MDGQRVQPKDYLKTAAKAKQRRRKYQFFLLRPSSARNSLSATSLVMPVLHSGDSTTSFVAGGKGPEVQEELPLAGGTCSPPPHPHTRHVPRARLADGTPAVTFTSFFGLGFLFFLRSALDRIRLPQCGASVTTCLTANPPPGPLSFF